MTIRVPSGRIRDSRTSSSRENSPNTIPQSTVTGSAISTVQQTAAGETAELDLRIRLEWQQP